ncbi:MAG: AMP-binding protein [Bacteroidales bacterium]|nr:AMP-binding protein [Bacteroidales bacterium]
MILKPQRLLGEGLLASAGKYPQKVAIISGGSEYTYRQLLGESLSLASSFIEKGLKKGDRVLVYMENSWTEAVAIYAVALAGGVFVAINPQTKTDKLRYIADDSGAEILITERRLKNEFDHFIENPGTLRTIFIKDGYDPEGRSEHVELVNLYELRVADSYSSGLPAVIPNDLAALIYTSGSTGFPKGVMMTHQSMVFATWSLIEYLRLTPEERIMLVLPMSFDYGLYQLLISVTVGATLIIEKNFIFLGSIYKRIKETEPTVFPGVPTTFSMMVSSYKREPITFPSVKKITNTAAALSPGFIPYLKKIFPNALIFKMYGLTECKRVSYLEPELIDIKPASVGKAIPGTEVFILSEDGNEVAPDETGVLYVRGPHVMLGYWNQEKLSNEVLKPGKLPWERVLCTNDLFKMDEEGFLYFVGRNDDIIKTRGEKVSPLEVEKIINRLDGVKGSAVIGVPDEIMGEVIIVFVSSENDKLMEKEIQHYCSRHLESFMIPQKVVLMKELPKTANGKIDKRSLKKSFLNEK